MLGWRLPRRRAGHARRDPGRALVEQAGQRGVHQRDLDVAAGAGPRALDQRGLDAVGRQQAADEVDDRGAGLQRPPVRLAGDGHQPAHRLQQEVVAGQPRPPRPRSAERGHRAGDEARVAARAACRRRGPRRRSARAGRTRSSRRRAAAERRAPARGRPGPRGRARSSACCGSGRGSRCSSPSCHGGPQARVSSPPSGRSTLITSAPRSPSSIAASGPASTREKSATRIPSSGGMAGTLVRAMRTLVVSDLHLGQTERRRPAAPRRSARAAAGGAGRRRPARDPRRRARAARGARTATRWRSPRRSSPTSARRSGRTRS